MNNSEILLKQSSVIFNSIADLAEQLEAVGVNLVDAIPPDDQNNLAARLAMIQESLAKQIGWLADHGAHLADKTMVCRGGAEEWFLPKTFNLLQDQLDNSK
ncbi:hypothetical protein TDB9533_03572 [Thalassocella blandensis]|nr:hypothetical protein TDB9533_03572 [Thalassocella blandensis]